MIRRPFVAAAALFAAVSGPAAAQDSDADLRAALAAAHRDASAQLDDRFAEPTVPRIAGTRFRLSFPFTDGQTTRDAPVGSGYFTYERGRLRLILPLRQGWARPGAPSQSILKFATRRRPGQSYTGTNAYGASARVNVTWIEEDAVAVLRRPDGETSPYSADMPTSAMTRLPRDTYWIEREVSGVAARQLAQSARVVIEGTAAALPSGDPAECSRNYGQPTVTRPREAFMRTCWVGADIHRIAFIDSRDGSVLREWRND